METETVGTAAELPRQNITPIESGFPSETAPLIYADGILNLAFGPGIAKFYFFRTDPNLIGGEGVKNTLVTQVVMPTDNLIAAIVSMMKIIEDTAAMSPGIKSTLDDVRRQIELRGKQP